MMIYVVMSTANVNRQILFILDERTTHFIIVIGSQNMLKYRCEVPIFILSDNCGPPSVNANIIDKEYRYIGNRHEVNKADILKLVIVRKTLSNVFQKFILLKR